MHIDQCWFDDYLCNRKQSVRINSYISSPKEVKYGVLQGSILGSILFLIHINDMAKKLNNCFLIQYADDSLIIISGKVEDLEDLKSRVEIVLKEAKTYFQVNALNINESITQCLIVGSRQLVSLVASDFEIEFGNIDIKPCSVKNLGIHMDQYMIYDIHVSHISRKVNGILLFLNRIKERFDKATRILVVQSLARSIVNYCIKVWGITTQQQIDKVQKLENFAAKFAVGGPKKYDHVTPIFDELK